MGSVFGDYELLGEIARGGMGVVYKARQRSLNRTVALKMILDGQLSSETSVQRFQQEARAAAAMDHPNIVPIYEVGQHDGHHYFTMAFVEGTSLKSLAQPGSLPTPQQAAAIVTAVAEAVEFAHQAGVVHRDLKPENVLIDRNGRPRVTDFGLAKCAEGDSGLTGSGQVLGTPSYMAPEQARGDSRAIGPATDVYALGGILYFLLTGGPPVTGGSVMEVLYRVLEDVPVPPRQVNPRAPRELEAVCLKCLEKDPGRRYASAAALAAALRQATSPAPADTVPLDPADRSVTPPALPAPAGGPSRGKAGRSRLALAGLATAGLALLALGVVLASGRWRAPVAPDRTPAEAPRDGAVPAAPASAALPPLRLPKASRRDFRLEVEMIGSGPGTAGAFQLVVGQEVRFRIEVERDAYVGVWTVGPDGTVVQLFPNQYEPDHLVKAHTPRTVPGGDYTIEAEVSAGVEQVRVVASTKPWATPRGQKQGPFQVFKTAQERESLEQHVRGLVLKPGSKKGKAAVSEAALEYRVVPARD